MQSQPLLSSRQRAQAQAELNESKISGESLPPPDSDSEEKQLPRTKSGLQRCKTAPAMDMGAVLRELKGKPQDQLDANDEDGDHKAAASGYGSGAGAEQILQAALLLVLYLTMGVVVYWLNRDNFSGLETHPVVDALYFCIVTMCTIGYGDITPLTPFTKIFACFFVLVGFGFIDILLSAVVNHVLDLQERNILAGIPAYRYRYQSHSNTTTSFFIDVAKGRMRIRLKVALAMAAVVVCIGLGTLVLYLVEGLSWVDSLYLSALSVTTVGYGDRAFSTFPGRLFAAVWLLFSTLAVARAFLYLVEARIDKRHRTFAKWVLQRDITPQDLLAANINNNNFINKSEYVLYKLKEMGKIGEQDVSQICNQFKKLDPNNLGRITLPDLLNNSS